MANSNPGKGNGGGPPGNGSGGKQSEYIIDETVTLPIDEPVKIWDLDIDPEEEETHVIRAIARSSGTRLRAYILPKEEVEFFEEEENIWWEYRSGDTDRIEDSTTITHDDEDPYYHEGDYVLALKAKTSGSRPDEFKFSVKFRRE